MYQKLSAQFREALTSFAAELAKLVVRDGEGATKFVTVTVAVCLHELLELLIFCLRWDYNIGCSDL